MTQNEKFQIQRRNTLRNLWQKLSGTPDFPVKLVLAALYLMGAAYVCVKQAAWRTLAGNIPLPSPLLKAAMEHALLAYLLAGAAALLALLPGQGLFPTHGSPAGRRGFFLPYHTASLLSGSVDLAALRSGPAQSAQNRPWTPR